MCVFHLPPELRRHIISFNRPFGEFEDLVRIRQQLRRVVFTCPGFLFEKGEREALFMTPQQHRRRYERIMAFMPAGKIYADKRQCPDGSIVVDLPF